MLRPFQRYITKTVLQSFAIQQHRKPTPREKTLLELLSLGSGNTNMVFKHEKKFFWKNNGLAFNNGLFGGEIILFPSFKISLLQMSQSSNISHNICMLTSKRLSHSKKTSLVSAVSWQASFMFRKEILIAQDGRTKGEAGGVNSAKHPLLSQLNRLP